MGLVGFLRKGDLQKAIDNTSDFMASRKFLGKDGESAIAMDDSRQLICLVKSVKRGPFKQPEFRATVVRGCDLVECEIIEDGWSREKTSGAGAFGRAMAGGALGGPVGGLIGGFGASKKITKTVTRMDLKIVISSGEDPAYMVCFRDMPAAKGTFGGDAAYKQTLEEANQWLYRLRNMMRNEQTHASTVSQQNQSAAANDTSSSNEMPGRFEVFGVDKESGMDTRDVISANSAANAKVKIELQGIVVTSVRRMGEYATQ